MTWLNLYTGNRILQGIILLCSDRHHTKNISLIWLKCTERQVQVMVRATKIILVFRQIL